MKSKSFGKTHLLVLDGGDDAMSGLIAFAKQNGIEGASLQAIGAFSSAVVAYWNRETKEYEEIPVDEQVEVLALGGNLAMSGDDVRVHAHVTLGRRDGSTIGGHLLRASVYPTLEVFIGELERIERGKDSDTGLMLIRI